MTALARLPPPRFIVLEGGDGSGKTTMRKFLFTELARRGRPPLSVNGSSWMDLESTEIITKAKYFKKRYPASQILNAYVKDRSKLCDVLVRPMLNERDVISDRYAYSDIVYSSLHFGLDRADMARRFRNARLVEPDVIFFLDTPPELAVERMIARGTPIKHWETLEMQRAIYSGYKSVLAARPLGWSCPTYAIDNTQPPSFAASLLQQIIGI